MTQNPSYLYQTSLGVFYFQRRVPETYLLKTPSLPRFVRLSLTTKHKRVARRLARALAVMLDIRQKQYFKDEESFHHGMKLLQEYLSANVNNLDLANAEEFFFKFIDDSSLYDITSLNQAIKYHNALQIEKGTDPFRLQISELSNLLSSQLNQSNTGVTGITLEQAFDDFLRNKRSGWNDHGGMESAFKSSYFPVIKGVVGDIKTNEITKIHTNEIIKILQNLPSNKSKFAQYRDLSFKDFLTIQVPESHKISQITLRRYLGQIGAFFRWLKSNDYTSIDLDAPLKNIKVKVKRSVDQQPAYSKSDLKKLFNSKIYLQGSHKSPSHFWVPLIALYTGARLNEICQLSIADIYVEKSTNRWVFDINEDKNDDPLKSLKKPFHARLVPIHSKLKELGFIDFFRQQQKLKIKKLFPDLPYISSANKYGDKLQRWFNRTYQTSCKITSNGTSFHSFRHTVISHLVNEKNVDDNKIAIGLGQTPVGGVTRKTYTKVTKFKDYSIYFDLIDFDDCFDSSAIRRWDKHLFNSIQTNNTPTKTTKSTIKKSNSSVRKPI